MVAIQVTVQTEKAKRVLKVLDELPINVVEELTLVNAGSNVLINIRAADEEKREIILSSLRNMGVGRRFGYIDLIPVVTFRAVKPKAKRRRIATTVFTEQRSVKAIYQASKQTNSFSSEFVLFLSMAALIAAAGLASNSVVSVVASMLVSPLMGPIIAFSLGFVYKDWYLVARGLKNEFIALGICVTMGFIYAFPFLPFAEQLGWPTDEMAGRGTITNLIFGILVACPSGVAVALSMTSSNIPGLVGVAISASLLPPAVNAGMCLNYALFGPVVSGNVDRSYMLIVSGTSFSLTMVNILCINLFSMMFFQAKRLIRSFLWYTPFRVDEDEFGFDELREEELEDEDDYDDDDDRLGNNGESFEFNSSGRFI